LQPEYIWGPKERLLVVWSLKEWWTKEIEKKKPVHVGDVLNLRKKARSK
jgi:hypothetical protein